MAAPHDPPADRPKPAVPPPLAPGFDRRRIAISVDDNGRLALARRGSIVVDGGDDLERIGEIAEFVARRDPNQRLEDVRRRAHSVTGLVPVDVSNFRTDSDDPLAAERAAAAEFIDAGFDASPNWVLFSAQNFGGDPAGAPVTTLGDLRYPVGRNADGAEVLVTSSTPAPAIPLRTPVVNAKRRPSVLVLDTGLRTVDAKGKEVEHPALRSAVKLHEPWLNSNEVDAPDDEDEIDADGDRRVDVQAGHGTFVAGVVHQHCPYAEIHTAGVLSSYGDGSVESLSAALQRAVAFCQPDVIVMAFGGFFDDDEPGPFATGLRRALRGHYRDAVVVAAAGNEQTSRPHFPAALDFVIAVGALAPTERAWFSNYGGWVNASAPGVDVVSTFFCDAIDERPDGTSSRYRGWATWSGTSFAAPKVAAAIATEQLLYGGSSADAWKRLTNSYQRRREPDLGQIFND